MPTRIAPNPTLATAARTLLLDAMAAECISALRIEGTRAILLKGPVTARWLYSAGSVRDYTDVDLLVSRAEFPRAAQTLEGLGYRDTQTGRFPNETAPHAHPFILERPSAHSSSKRFPPGLQVDLHWSFHGIGVPDEEFWSVIAEGAGRMAISGIEVWVPSEAARALFLGLHAATSGADVGQPLADLKRGLECVPDETWKAAHDLAVRLDALPRFAAGLATQARGIQLIDRLHLAGAIDVLSALHAAGVPPVARSFERLRGTSGVGARTALIRRELVPSPSFMRTWLPLAARGPLGLALAYAYRPFWLLAKLPVALRAYARVRRQVEADDLDLTSRDRRDRRARERLAARH
jgi:hypothetical protein